jgi:hypothetical protein
MTGRPPASRVAVIGDTEADPGEEEEERDEERE